MTICIATTFGLSYDIQLFVVVCFRVFSLLLFLVTEMSSTEEDEDKTLQAKRIFVNCVDSYQGKNFAKVTNVRYRARKFTFDTHFNRFENVCCFQSRRKPD